MSYLEFGFNEGLAYKHDFQQDIQNLHQDEVLDRQARVDAESKAQLLGDKFKFGKAYDTYNNARLKTFTEDKIKEIGKFTDQNRDFMTNPMGWATFNKLTNDLVDNDVVQESARVKMHLDEMLKFQQAHPEMANSPRMRRQIDAYHNYAMTGSAEPGSDIPHEFMFVPPTPYKDLNAEAVRYGNGIKDFDVVKLDPYEHGLGAWESKPKPEALRATVHAMYMDNKDQIEEQYQQAGYSSPQEYALAMLLPGIPKQYKKGDFASLIRMEVEGNKAKKYGKDISPYQRDILDRKAGEMPPESVKQMFGITPPVTTVYGTGVDEKINWNGREVKWNGRFRQISYQGKKVKAAEGTITIPWDEAVDRNIGRYWDLKNEAGNADVKDRFKEFATRRQDEKGNWVCDVEVLKPFDETADIYKEIYDGPVANKFKTAPGTTTETVKLIGEKMLEGKKYMHDEEGNWYHEDGTPVSEEE